MAWRIINFLSKYDPTSTAVFGRGPPISDDLHCWNLKRSGLARHWSYCFPVLMYRSVWIRWTAKSTAGSPDSDSTPSINIWTTASMAELEPRGKHECKNCNPWILPLLPAGTQVSGEVTDRLIGSHAGKWCIRSVVSWHHLEPKTEPISKLFYTPSLLKLGSGNQRLGVSSP